MITRYLYYTIMGMVVTSPKKHYHHFFRYILTVLGSPTILGGMAECQFDFGFGTDQSSIPILGTNWR